ncbi:hypothetical protein ACMAY5_00765 [Arenicellales bacterium nBUS_48]
MNQVHENYRRSIFRRLFTTTVVGLLWSHLTIAAEVAGFVEQLTGDSDQHVVIRDNKTIPISIFSEVLVGDVISIPEEASDVTIGLRLANGSLVVITEHDDAVQLNSGAAVVTARANVVHWMKDYLHSLSAAEEVDTVSLSTRGAVVTPMPSKVLFTFAGEVNYVSAERGSIGIEWIHGVPPFSLTLVESESQSQIWAMNQIKNGIFVTCPDRDTRPTVSQQIKVFKQSISLRGVRAGVYTLSIADKFGNTATRQFQFDKPFLDLTFEGSQLVSQASENVSQFQSMINAMRCDSIRRD